MSEESDEEPSADEADSGDGSDGGRAAARSSPAAENGAHKASEEGGKRKLGRGSRAGTPRESAKEEVLKANGKCSAEAPRRKRLRKVGD